MIPDPQVHLSALDARRWEFTRLAAVLAEAGVPAEVIVADARDGIGVAERRHRRSGR